MRILPGEAALLAEAEALLRQYRAAGLTIATAESCTGGLIAAALTAIAGSSDVVLGGFVTYSNRIKAAVLGVPAGLIAREGAVSEAVVRAMASGAIQRSGADLAIAVSGVAGPGGGSAEKPVGLVWLAAQRGDAAARVERHVFAGDRQAVRALTVGAALRMLGEQAALPAGLPDQGGAGLPDQGGAGLPDQGGGSSSASGEEGPAAGP